MSGVLDAILGAIGTLIYPLFSIIFLLIDLVQAIFEAFAGIGNAGYGGGWGTAQNITSGNSGETTDTGLIYYIMQQPVIKNMLLSMIYLALILLVVFTVMAVIKNVYVAQPKKWQDIVGDAIKGLGNFIIIPVCCLLGIWLANIGLQAVNSATRQSGAKSMSRQLFICAAYNANWWRKQYMENPNGTITQDDYEKIVELAVKYPVNGKVVTVEANRDLEYYAETVDYIYANSDNQALTASIYSGWAINPYYNLIDINYVILVGGGAFMLYALGAISFGMVKRLIYLLMLYIISPIPCALYPLKGDSAVGTWRTEFVKNTLSAYGAVAGMNLFFSISPIIQNIKVDHWFADGIGLLPLILTVAGLFVVKEFINFITSLVGGTNAYAEGVGLMGNVKSRAQKDMGKISKGTARVAGAFGETHRARRLAGASGQSKFSAGGRAFFQSMTGAKEDENGHWLGSAVGKMIGSAFNPKGLGLDVNGIADAIKSGNDKKGTDKFIKQLNEINPAITEEKDANGNTIYKDKNNKVISEEERRDLLIKGYNTAGDLLSSLDENDERAKAVRKKLGFKNKEDWAGQIADMKDAVEKVSASRIADEKVSDAQDLLNRFASTDYENLKTTNRESYDRDAKAFKDVLGVDFEEALKLKSGYTFSSGGESLGIKEIIENILKGNQNFSSDEVVFSKVKSERGVEDDKDANERINQRKIEMKINEAYQNINKSKEEADNATLESVGKLKTGSDSVFGINQSSIDQLSKAIKEGKSDDAQKIVATLDMQGLKNVVNKITTEVSKIVRLQEKQSREKKNDKDKK